MQNYLANRYCVHLKFLIQLVSVLNKNFIRVTECSFIFFLLLEKSATSDSSGVCTSNSAASYESGQYFDAFLPGSRCICVVDYTAPVPGHLQLCNGDVVESMFIGFFLYYVKNIVYCFYITP